MIPKVYVPMQKICHHKCSILPSFLQQIESQRFSVFYLLFLCLLHETWLSITFPEFLPENLRVKFCQWLKVLLWQPCCQDLVQLKNHKQSFCVYYFHFWNLESGSWQEHFSVFFFFFFLIINAIAIVLNEIRECEFLIKRLTSPIIFLLYVCIRLVYTCSRFHYHYIFHSPKIEAGWKKDAWSHGSPI